MPKRKEQEALSPKDVHDYRDEITKKGDCFATAIAPDYPDAEGVREAIRDVLETVEHFGLVGRWVTSHSGAEYVTNQEIRSVSIISYSF